MRIVLPGSSESTNLAQHPEIDEPVEHRSRAYLKSLGQEANCILVIQVQIVLLNLLLNRPAGHQ